MRDSRDRNGRAAAPDYTLAVIVSGGVVVFMALCAIQAAWGFPVAVAMAWAVDRMFLRRA